MAHSSSTPNYHLPQFATTDKPAWLTDINGAFSTIDTAIDTAKDTADAAASTASTASTTATAASTAATSAGNKADGALASISETFETTNTYAVGDLVMYNSLLYRCTVAVETPGAWTGSSNWERVNFDGLYSALKSEVASNDTDISDIYSTLASMYEVNDISQGVTLAQNISIQSWGYVKVYKSSRVIIISFSGLRSSVALANNNVFTLPVNVTGTFCSIGKAGNDACFIYNSGNVIQISDAPANTNVAGQIVIFNAT